MAEKSQEQLRQEYIFQQQRDSLEFLNAVESLGHEEAEATLEITPGRLELVIKCHQETLLLPPRLFLPEPPPAKTTRKRKGK